MINKLTLLPNRIHFRFKEVNISPKLLTWIRYLQTTNSLYYEYLMDGVIKSVSFVTCTQHQPVVIGGGEEEVIDLLPTHLIPGDDQKHLFKITLCRYG